MESRALSQRLVLVIVAGALAALVACAPDVRRRPVELIPLAASERGQIVTVVNEVIVTPSIGFPRTIAAGSKWRQIGRIGDGAVFRPVVGVFTVEGAHVHEAALVIATDKITGFYMLVEKGLVDLEPAVFIHLEKEGGK